MNVLTPVSRMASMVSENLSLESRVSLQPGTLRTEVSKIIQVLERTMEEENVVLCHGDLKVKKP